MWKFAILLSIAPFIVGAVLANIFGLRILRRSTKLSMSVDQVALKMLRILNRQDIQIRYIKRGLWPNTASGKLEITERRRSSTSATHIAEVQLQLGMLLLREKHQPVVDWRVKSLKLGYIIPLFTLLIVLFSCTVGKLPVVIMFAAIAISLGATTITLWLSMGVEKEAAHLMVSRIEKLRLFPRLRDEEAVVESLRALPWAALIPGALKKLIN